MVSAVFYSSNVFFFLSKLISSDYVTRYLHIKVVMPREVCVQNEFFDLIVFSIKQNVLQ